LPWKWDKESINRDHMFRKAKRREEGRAESQGAGSKGRVFREKCGERRRKRGSLEGDVVVGIGQG